MSKIGMMLVGLCFLGGVGQAFALEPEQALSEVRMAVERRIATDLAARIGTGQLVLASAQGVFYRGKYSPGKTSNYMGTLEVIFQDPTTFQGYQTQCNVFVNVVRELRKAARRGEVVLADDEHGKLTIAQLKEINCDDGQAR